MGKSRLSKDEIEKMVEDAEKFKKDDEEEAERLKGKLSLEAYCLDLKSAMENPKLDQTKIINEKKTIIDKCDKAQKWIEKNKLASKEEFEHKEKEVKAKCDTLITAMFKNAGIDDNEIPGHHSHSHGHSHGHGHGHGGGHGHHETDPHGHDNHGHGHGHGHHDEHKHKKEGHKHGNHGHEDHHGSGHGDHHHGHGHHERGHSEHKGDHPHGHGDHHEK